MSAASLVLLLSTAAQMAVGITLVVAGVLTLAVFTDRRTRRTARWPMCGLVAWGMWFALQPVAQRPDSPPAIAFAGLVAYVLIVHQRRVVAYLEGRG